MIMFQHLGRWGRLGNQLFQYATLFSIAKQNGYEMGVPFHHKSDNPYAHFFLDDCFETLSAKSCLDIPVHNLYQEPYPNNINFNPEVLNLPDSTNIHGYFQSEKYFKKFKTELLQEFKFKKNIEDISLKIKMQLPEDCIAVHVRVGDYQYMQNSHPICQKEYYAEAIKQMPTNMPFVVFSDNKDYSINMFKEFNVSYYFVETGNEFVDLCLMSKFNYHIIANSSFSWWGSWLSNSKKTIAPRKWFGDSQEVPKQWDDIYCEEWVVI